MKKEKLIKIKKNAIKIEPQAKALEPSPEALKMLTRLDKLDVFIEGLVKKEGEDIVTPQIIVDMLIIKARHIAFVHAPDSHPYQMVACLIEMILYRADEVFKAVRKVKE